MTLAETLIALTIIGIVAAMTVPNLMSNFRKREIETALPIAYKLIDDAVKLSVMENGEQSTWKYTDSGNLTEKYFLPYLKVGKICGLETDAANNVKAKGCFKYPFPGSRSAHNGSWYQLNGKREAQSGYSSESFYTMVLANGMHLGIWAHRNHEDKAYQRYRGIFFVVDVNGKSGPTTLGRDVFSFRFNYDTNQLEVGKGHIDTKRDCESLTQAGYSCAAAIRNNGWKIPDDYPVKKW